MALLTEEELMEYIKVSRKTINEWREKGLPYLKPSRAIRYEKEEVIKWMKDNTKRVD